MFISLIIVVLAIVLFIAYGSYVTKDNEHVSKSKKNIKKFLDYLK